MYSLSMLSVAIPPGDTYTIHIPATLSNGKGFWPRTQGVVLWNGESRELQRGFCVENEKAGKIDHWYPDKVAIDYKHIYPIDNVIWFFALTGEVVKINVGGVIDIHDHSTISTGGPAFGTYYSQPIIGGDV